MSKVPISGVRFVNRAGRAGLVVDGKVVDLEQASDGKLPPDPMEALARWDEVRALRVSAPPEAPAYDEARVGPPVPRPSKVFGVGLNYRAHAEEAGLEVPSIPLIFTKFPNCICGPRADVEMTGNRVDYEVELVVVMGRRARNLAAADVRDHLAGYTVGQDISDRAMQFSGKPPQFSMGKSVDTFGPIGPAIISLDAFEDPDDLPIRCEVAGELRQEDRTSGMIFSVTELVVFLSRYCTLLPGDLIFSGTPAGVGSVRNPRTYLEVGQEIVSSIDGIGTLRNRCVEAA
jgi:2-keto-4-pentenoate hydratase/2-oxohepta-3-ene-1,7-dioic acid hydratase in catechol pathway